MSEKPRIGFIGIGMMGKPISNRVLQAGYPMIVHDAIPERVEELVRQGATKAATPKEVAELSDVVLTSLPTLQACREVYLGSSGLLKGARAGEILVETSTVSPSLIKEYALAAEKQGVSVIDASLLASGRPGLPGSADQIAAQGRVMLVVGGETEEIEKVRPILETFANPLLHMGPLGSGALTKVVSNALARANFTAACEILSVGAKAGANMRNLYEVLSQNAGRSYVLEGPVLKFLQSGTAPLMRTEAAVKDSESMLKVAAELGVPVLVQSLCHAWYELAMGSGMKDRPHIEILKLWEGVIGKPIRFE
jgi:3-hydroxyisobutyrate dehydrogenase-like beta-hydroxyacid dehydrogenase